MLARREGADVVHAASPRAGLLAACCLLTPPRRVVDVRDVLPGGAKAAAVRWTLRLTADLIVFNSRFTRDRFGLTRPAGAAVVYPPVDVERLLELPLPSRETRGAPPVLGVLGQITPWKGQDDAIRILASVRNHFPDARLRIVGSVVFSGGSVTLDNEAFQAPAATPRSRARGRRRGRARRPERRSQRGARVARRAARPVLGGALRKGRRGGHGGRRAGDRNGCRGAEERSSRTASADFWLLRAIRRCGSTRSPASWRASSSRGGSRSRPATASPPCSATRPSRRPGCTRSMRTGPRARRDRRLRSSGCSDESALDRSSQGDDPLVRCGLRKRRSRTTFRAAGRGELAGAVTSTPITARSRRPATRPAAGSTPEPSGRRSPIRRSGSARAGGPTSAESCSIGQSRGASRRTAEAHRLLGADPPDVRSRRTPTRSSSSRRRHTSTGSGSDTAPRFAPTRSNGPG